MPFDSNIDNANTRKLDKYEQLKNELEIEGYCVNLKAFEISSRGLITKRNNECLKHLLDIKNSDLKSMCKKLQKIVIIASYVIFHSKYEHDWISPPLVSIQ